MWLEVVSISLSGCLLPVRKCAYRKQNLLLPPLWTCPLFKYFIFNFQWQFLLSRHGSCVWQSAGFQHASVARGARSCRARLLWSQSVQCFGHGCAVVHGSSACAAGKRVEYNTSEYVEWMSELTTGRSAEAQADVHCSECTFCQKLAYLRWIHLIALYIRCIETPFSLISLWFKRSQGPLLSWVSLPKNNSKVLIISLLLFWIGAKFSQLRSSNWRLRVSRTSCTVVSLNAGAEAVKGRNQLRW